MPRADGTDVSEFQGMIDFTSLQRSGITWAGMRVRHSRTDRMFFRNRAGLAFCRHRLLYHFLEPGESATAYLSTVGTFAQGEGAMLDAEAAGITVDDCVRWCDQVEAATQRPVAVYTGKFVSGGSIWASTRIFNGQRARIFAAYTTEFNARTLASPFTWDAWQFTDKGTLPGIATLVDLDQVDNPAVFDRVCGLPSGTTQADADLIALRVWS